MTGVDSQQGQPASADMAGVPPQDSPVSAGSPARLWFPRDMAVASLLLGFPGGFGLAARNSWRLGRRGIAWLLLLAGIAASMALVFVVPGNLPSAAYYAVNVAVIAALYLVMRRQLDSARRAGRTVERGSGASGLATFLGGWVATAGPTFLLFVALVFLGSQVAAILGGTVQFGTAGSGCAVEAAATSIPGSEPIHYAAYLSRKATPGEVIHVTVREAASTASESVDIAVDAISDCVSGTIPARTLAPGSYAFTFDIGTEQLAAGEVVITRP